MLLIIKDGEFNDRNAGYTYSKGGWRFIFKGYFSFDNSMYTGEKACRFIEQKMMQEGTISPGDLNGIFLAIIINEKKQLIQVLNDRFGFYQVFYASDNKSFYFGDDFWEVAGRIKSRKIGQKELNEFLQFRFVSGKNTLAENVFCIEPASLYTMDFSKDKISIDRSEYWHFNYEPQKYSEQEAEEAIYNCLSGIIKRYDKALFRDKNIGINLTGGFDSRYLLALLLQQQNKPEKIHTFTYGSSDCDDMQIAKQLTETLKVHSHFEIFDPYFRDFFRPGQISEIVKEIGFYTYYLQGYAALKLNEKYRKIDYLLTGSDGYFVGLMANDKLFGLEDFEQLSDYIYQINATMLSPEEIKQLSTSGPGKIKEEIVDKINSSLSGFPGNAISAYFDWTLKNRHRKYLLSIYELQNRHALHLMPFYDYEFIDLMAKLPYEMLADQKAYVSSLFKLAMADELSFMREVPFELRGKLISAGKDVTTKKISKFTFRKIREKLMNPPDNKFQYPIQQILRKFPDLWDTIHNELQISNSRYLDSEKCISMIEKNKRNNIFTRYGLVVILSVIRFEKMLSNNPVREE